MSTKLGTLTLDLIAKIGSFTGPMQQAEKQTKLSFDNMRAHANTYGMAVAGAAGSAVMALGAMAASTANQAADLEKFAARAQTTTQEFQKMAVGASALGIEGEQLSDMMKDFNEKMGELTAVGSGGAKDFFDKLSGDMKGGAQEAKGLILEMQKLSGPEALQLYVDKLEDAGVSQSEMSFYLESMASDLTDLYPLLANGGEGMKIYGDMAERAGVIMSDNTKEAALALKDQMFMLDLQFKGVQNQLMAAVIPAFVDVADAFLGGSEQGLQFTTVADGIGESLRFVAKMAIGVVTNIQLAAKAMGAMGAVYGSIQNNKDWYELGPLGYAKALFDARGEIASIGKSYISDADEMLLNAAAKMDAIDNRVGSSKASQLRGIREIQQRQASSATGLQDVIDKENKVKNAVSGQNKALQEQNRLLEQQRREREQISKTYSTDFENINSSENEELKRILGAGFASADQEKFTNLAKMRFEGERAEYFKSLNLEVNQYKWSEAKKLEYTYQMDREIAENDTRLSGVVKEAKLKFIDEQYAYQKRELEINQAKELLETKKLWMSAGDYAQEYYALVRDEILNTSSYSPAMKAAKIQQADSQQNTEFSNERDQVISGYRDTIGYEESPLVKQYEVLDKMRQLDLISEEKYQQDKLQLQAMSTTSYMEGMFSGFASIVDENSKTYAVLFAAQKAFAVAQAMLNIPSAYSKAYDAVVGTPYIGPYIAPAVGAAAAALQVAQAADIKGISMPGYATGGLISGPGTGTSDDIPIMASNGEFMLKAATVSAIGVNNLTALNDNPSTFMQDRSLNIPSFSGISAQQPEVKVIIENHTSGQVQTRADGNNIRVIIREEINRYVPAQIEQPNSKIRKALSANTTATARR